MRVVIFGTGKLYEKNRLKIRKDLEIVAFLDNQLAKQGTILDGKPIVDPKEILILQYDFVFILSGFFVEMKEQLSNLGVPESKIYDINRMEVLCEVENTKWYGEISRNKKRRHILVFSHSLTSTGAQNVLFIAVGVLKQNGYDVVVVSKEDGVLRDKFLNEQVPVIILSNFNGEDTHFCKLVEWADQILINTAWLYYIIKKFESVNKKIIWWIHESGALSYIGRVELQQICGKDNIKIFVVSEVVKNKFEEICGKGRPVDILRYGIQDYSKNKCVEKKDKKIFAIIGSISKMKGQDLFISAVKKLPEEYRNKAEFWIVGGGTFSKEDLQNVENCSCLKIIGEIKNEEVKELYQKIDVVVCCSREDALPVVVTEGFMNDKLVILSEAIGTAKYVVNGETALIMKKEDVQHLVDLIKWVLDNESEAMKIGRASRQIYKKFFSLKVFEKNLLREFSTILS